MKINAGKKVPPERFGETISDILINWSDEEEQKFFDAIDEATEACDTKAEQYLWKGHGLLTGDYRSHFSIDSGLVSKHHKYGTWYVEEPEYRLTHLLEYGHLISDGTGRETKPVKHIKYGRKIAEQVLEERTSKLWQG